MRFLLVHGSCHAAWCWQDLLPRLVLAGAEARSIDLPAHGADRSDPAAVTLSDYGTAILDRIEDPVILVGHSAGGFPITAAAEAAQGKVSGLIYLCAYIPRPGLSVADLRRAGPSQPLRGKILHDRGAPTYRFDPATIAPLLFHDCPPGTASRALPLLGAEPVAPQETALPLTEASHSLPRHAIVTTADRVIPPEWQAAMAHAAGVDTSSLDCGHSPYFAAPDALAARLLDIAARFRGTS
ncbi:alpha/beta fold hydrolase [Tabrizicola sp. J26]|nr:alpha/beta fold hydrolase [Tabrizicola rongguiensis]